MGWPKGKPRPPEQRAKIAAGLKKRSPETLARIAAAAQTPEAKAKHRAAVLGRKHSPETRAKMSASHNGLSDEHKAKLQAALKRPEVMAKRAAAISRGKTGLPRPDIAGDKALMRRPEIAAKVSRAQRGRPVPVEKRAKIRATLRSKNSDPSYVAIHDRVAADRGKACVHACSHCPEQAEQWALVPGYGRSERGKGGHTADEPNLRASPTGQLYSLDIMDYEPVCEPCHRRLDYGA
jgi:hypothetical protein